MLQSIRCYAARAEAMLTAFALVATTPAVAHEKQLQVCDQPATRIDPIRVCGVRLLDDGRVMPTTDWIDYQQHISTSCGSTLDCWDAFGNDGVSAPWGGEACALPGEDYRWYFGRDYVNPFYAGNWNKGTDGRVSDSTRVEFFWYHRYGTETFYYFLFTGMNQPGDCTYSVDYPGVAYEIGTVPQGPAWTEVDLGGTGLFHTLDPDGQGSYVGILADGWDGENVVLGQAQPMLWGANASSQRIPLVGTNHDIELDDDHPTDGFLDPDHECYSYAFGICPDPLQACVGFGNCGPSDVFCSGHERLLPITRLLGSGCKLKLLLKRGLPDTPYKVVLPNGDCRLGYTNQRGKHVFLAKAITDGTASIPNCHVTVEVFCP